MTRLDVCPSCGQPAHPIRYQAHRNDVEGSALIEVVLGVLILSMFVVGLIVWSWIAEAAR